MTTVKTAARETSNPEAQSITFMQPRSHGWVPRESGGGWGLNDTILSNVFV